MIEISTTLPTQEAALELAREIIDRSFGACVQVTGPIMSTYRWQGAVETGQEWKLVVKTTETVQEKLVDYLLQSHPYELPEIVAHSVCWVEPKFEEWVRSQADR